MFLALELNHASGGTISVRVDDTELTIVPGPSGAAVAIPGWIWEGHGRGQTEIGLTVRAGETGDTQSVPVSRDMVLAGFQALSRTPLETASDHALVTALEHAHHGAFWDDMEASVRDYLVTAACALGLAGILPPDLAPDTPAEPPDPPVVQTILRRFGRAVRAAGADTSADLLRDILEEYDLPLDIRLMLIRELTPHFCRADRIEALFDALVPQEGPAAVNFDEARPWTFSLCLPARYLCEDFDTVQAVMDRLAAEPQNWASTPAVAWLLQRVVSSNEPFVPFHLFEGLIRAGLTFIDSRAQEGRGGTHCAALREAAAQLLARRWMCSDRLQQQIGETLARSFGCSPAFWAAVGAHGLSDLPPVLTDARQTLSCIRDGSRQAEDNPAAIRPIGTDRMAQEVAGLPDPSARSDLPLLLRAAAAPFAPPPDASVMPALAQAVRAAYVGQPQSPAVDLQHRTMQTALRVLNAAADTPAHPDDALLADLAAGLTRLAGMATGALGLGLCLALIDDLLAHQAAPWADRLARLMQPVFQRVTRNAGDALTGAAAVITAANRLAAAAQPGDPAQRLLDDLPAQLRDLPGTPPPPWPGSKALFDTLVVIYSCRANLNTRIPDLRATWLGDLQALGVPYVILTGGDHTGRDGDILTVNAPDDYEGLPAKTLAMIEWACRETGFGHLLKIDDDCYLDAQAFFLDPTYRRHPYYGRRLEKRGALVNRTWHQARSRSRAAQLGFEKLPRNALYADGGTGYMLNRTAMTALLDQLETPEGQVLKSTAFSEDKLVGALLSRAGIEPAEMSYHTAVERRAAPGDPAVPQWVSGLRPNALHVTKLTHLDAGADMAGVHAARNDPRPRPPRIWPTHTAPKLGFNSGALHLLSPEKRLRDVIGSEMAVISVVRNEHGMLPHFLNWYRTRGVTGFLIADNGSEDGTLSYLLDQPDVALFSADTEFRETDQGTDWKIGLLAHYRLNRWSLVADADELLLYPGYGTRSLPDWLSGVSGDAVLVRMLDLYPRGPLHEARLETGNLFDLAPYTDRQPFLADSLSAGPYENAQTWTSAVRHRLMPGARPELFVAQKVPLLRYRPWMQLSTSLHYASDVTLAPESLLFAHFKYHAEFTGKARREILRGQYFNNAEEYRRYLNLFGQGDDRIFDPEISVRWEDCDAVRKLLG